MHLINLSLGTSNRAHAGAFEAAVSRAVTAGVAVVAARDDEGVRWLLAGCLPGVVQVQVDWNCPREHVQVARVEGAARQMRLAAGKSSSSTPPVHGN